MAFLIGHRILVGCTISCVYSSHLCFHSSFQMAPRYLLRHSLWPNKMWKAASLWMSQQICNEKLPNWAKGQNESRITVVSSAGSIMLIWDSVELVYESTIKLSSLQTDRKTLLVSSGSTNYSKRPKSSKALSENTFWFRTILNGTVLMRSIVCSRQRNS